jgi:hypothetical protein
MGFEEGYFTRHVTLLHSAERNPEHSIPKRKIFLRSIPSDAIGF